MPRYVAFLRAVSPMNAKMPELKRCFESAGFTGVRTLLSSGNVVFDAGAAAESALERRAEAAMAKRLGRAFYTIVRPTAVLRAMIEADPYAGFRVPANAKRVVTFSRAPLAPRRALPAAVDGARILVATDREVFSIYVPGPRGPVFMVLIEKTFGREVTTRTWDTVRKCAEA